MVVIGSAYFIALAGIRALHDRRERRTARPAPADASSAAESR
jgi:hypothetical protein